MVGKVAKSIFVTGLSGFVGSELHRILKRRGAEVIGLARKEHGDWVESLTQALETKPAKANTILVHLAAPDVRTDAGVWGRYHLATISLYEAAQKFGVETIFISSLSAHPENPSDYAIQKALSEKIAASFQIPQIALGIVQSQDPRSPYQRFFVLQKLAGRRSPIFSSGALRLTSNSDLSCLARRILRGEHSPSASHVDCASVFLNQPPSRSPGVNSALGGKATRASVIFLKKIFPRSELVDSLVNLHFGMRV